MNEVYEELKNIIERIIYARRNFLNFGKNIVLKNQIRKKQMRFFENTKKRIFFS